MPGCAAACERCKLAEPSPRCPPAELPQCTCAEGIELVPIEGAVPVAGDYRAARRVAPATPRGEVILQNSYTAFPAVLDAQLFYDAQDDRLWPVERSQNYPEY